MTPSINNHRPRGLRRAAVAALATAGLTAGVAFGAPADLDRGFGRDGVASITSPGNDYAYGAALQRDGSVVLGGQAGPHPAAFRLRGDGSPDNGFGKGGVQTITTLEEDGASAVAVQPGSGVLLAGYTSIGQNGAVWRLKPGDGERDGSFGAGGVAYVDSGGNERLYGMAVAPDGKIVVVGQTTVASSAAVYRLTAAGAPDSTFDQDGARGVDLGGEESARAVAIQPDGKIVVVGTTYRTNGYDLLVARFTDGGQPDPAFGGGDGIATVDTGVGEGATAVTLQADGHILVAGWNQSGAAVYRLTSAGALDGVAPLALGSDDNAQSVAVDPSGRILVGVISVNDVGADIAAVFRLRADLSRDTSFGQNGRLVTRAGGLSSATGVFVRGDGKILVTGAQDRDESDVVVLRLQGVADKAGAPRGGTGNGPSGGRGPAAKQRCAGLVATIVGTRRADHIRGTSRRDVIVGLGGNDVIRGLGGNDVICGGSGRDRLIGGAGRDRLFGGAGRDRLIGGPGRDRQRQ